MMYEFMNRRGNFMRKVWLFLDWKQKHFSSWPMVGRLIRAKTEMQELTVKGPRLPASHQVSGGHPSLSSVTERVLPGRHSQSPATLLQPDSAASLDSPNQTHLNSQDLSHVLLCLWPTQKYPALFEANTPKRRPLCFPSYTYTQPILPSLNSQLNDLDLDSMFEPLDLVFIPDILEV